MWFTRNLAMPASVGFLACAVWRTIDPWQGRAFPETIFTIAMVVPAACIYDPNRDLMVRAPMRWTRFFLMFFLAVLIMVVGVGLGHRLMSPDRVRLVSDLGDLGTGVSVIFPCMSARRRRQRALLQ